MLRSDEFAVKCDTVAQYQILNWLFVQGVRSYDIQRVDLLDGVRVKVTNPCGGYMIVIHDGPDNIYIDQSPDDGDKKGGTHD